MFGFGYTLTIVLLGTMLLGSITGAYGTFIVLRKQSLVGDALAHATLPGIVIAFMMTQTRTLSWLLLGATISALFAMLILNGLKRYTRIKFDAGMAIILAGFFGFGQMLLSYVQKTSTASQAGLSRFILGQAATMLRQDVLTIAGVSLAILVIMLMFWKEMKLYVFDPVFFRTLGLNDAFIERLMTLLTVIIVVIGIRTVGVVLISALIIAPAVIARQLSHRFEVNVGLAAIVGMAAAVTGTLLSATRSNLPTGPVIALILGVLVILAILFSPRRGMIWQLYRDIRHRKAIVWAKPLIHLYEQRTPHLPEKVDYERYIASGDILYTDTTLTLTPQGVQRVRRLMGEGPS